MMVRVQKTQSTEIDIELAKEAYKAYVRKYGHSQTFDRIIERGGFSWAEIAYHLYEQIQYLESHTGNRTTTGDEMNKKHESEFENVVKPLMKYMADNFHPHTKIVVDGSSAEVIEVISRTTTDQFIKD